MVLVFPIGVPAVFFTVMYKYRLRIDELVIRLKRHDDENNSFTSVREHTVIALAHGATNDPQQTSSLSRRQSFATQATDLLWLAKKIDMFKPGRWWTSGFLISMRIVQTSVMVFLPNPSLRAAAASLIALAGVCVQMNTSPYRRPSE